VTMTVVRNRRTKSDATATAAVNVPERDPFRPIPVDQVNGDRAEGECGGC